jgi:hypothetical protein
MIKELKIVTSPDPRAQAVDPVSIGIPTGHKMDNSGHALSIEAVVRIKDGRTSRSITNGTATLPINPNTGL